MLTGHHPTLGQLLVEFDFVTKVLGGGELFVPIQKLKQDCAQLPDCGGACLVFPLNEELWRSVGRGSYNTQTKGRRR